MLGESCHPLGIILCLQLSPLFSLSSPTVFSLLATRAQVLSAMGKPKGAIRDADRALQLNADSVHALRWRGKARAQLGLW